MYWPAAHQELSKSAVFARANWQFISAKFTDFQTKVCDKLFKNGVDTEQFRLFVTNQFPPGDCIPPPPAGLKEIFKAITHHGLWNYFHYSPLVRIVHTFGAGDSEMEGWVQTYKKDLKAYCIVATLADFIEADLDVTDTPPTSRVKYDPHYYHPVRWRSEQTNHTLQYFSEVWATFSSYYLLSDSPPVALLDRLWNPEGLLYEKVAEVNTSSLYMYVCVFKIIQLRSMSYCKMLKQQSLFV